MNNEREGYEYGTNEGNWREVGENEKKASTDAGQGRHRDGVQGTFGKEEEQADKSVEPKFVDKKKRADTEQI